MLPKSTAYGWMMLAGIVVSLVFWARRARSDERLVMIYLAALCGAFLGAKIVYVAAEGWLHFGAPDMWMQLLTGKSILGALLGGYVAVECAKKAVGYTKVTGDLFAIIVPFSISIGRVGCLLHGCCLGEKCGSAWYTMRDVAGAARWPAVPVEIAFNVVFIGVAALLRARHKLPGQHFHLYLIAYGLFRFAHEFARATPHVLGIFSGYQIAALLVAGLGMAGFVRRQAEKTNV